MPDRISVVTGMNCPQLSGLASVPNYPTPADAAPLAVLDEREKVRFGALPLTGALDGAA